MNEKLDKIGGKCAKGTGSSSTNSFEVGKKADKHKGYMHHAIQNWRGLKIEKQNPIFKSPIVVSNHDGNLCFITSKSCG
jgi:tRNA U34 2-thiouridine synthase MnmA/TrmU